MQSRCGNVKNIALARPSRPTIVQFVAHHANAETIQVTKPRVTSGPQRAHPRSGRETGASGNDGGGGGGGEKRRRGEKSSFSFFPRFSLFFLFFFFLFFFFPVDSARPSFPPAPRSGPGSPRMQKAWSELKRCSRVNPHKLLPINSNKNVRNRLRYIKQSGYRWVEYVTTHSLLFV